MRLDFVLEDSSIVEKYVPNGYTVPIKGDVVILEDSKFNKSRYEVISRELKFSDHLDRTTVKIILKKLL